MKRVLRFTVVILLFTILLCACSSRSGVYGGEPLDEEKLSEIKSSIFTEKESDRINESTFAEKDEINTEKEIDDDIETTAANLDEDASANATEALTEEESEETKVDTDASDETESEKATESKSATEHESATESSEIGIVYWTKNGTVWHTVKECGHIKNSEAISGTVDEAKEAGKTRLCSSCAK